MMFQISSEVYRDKGNAIETAFIRQRFTEPNEHKARRRVIEGFNYKGWFVRKISVVRVSCQ